MGIPMAASDFSCNFSPSILTSGLEQCVQRTSFIVVYGGTCNLFWLFKCIILDCLDQTHNVRWLNLPPKVLSFPHARGKLMLRHEKLLKSLILHKMSSKCGRWFVMATQFSECFGFCNSLFWWQNLEGSCFFTGSRFAVLQRAVLRFVGSVEDGWASIVNDPNYQVIDQ